MHRAKICTHVLKPENETKKTLGGKNEKKKKNSFEETKLVSSLLLNAKCCLGLKKIVLGRKKFLA
jgi:hypothetical protein